MQISEKEDKAEQVSQKIKKFFAFFLRFYLIFSSGFVTIQLIFTNINLCLCSKARIFRRKAGKEETKVQQVTIRARLFLLAGDAMFNVKIVSV